MQSLNRFSIKVWMVKDGTAKVIMEGPLGALVANQKLYGNFRGNDDFLLGTIQTKKLDLKGAEFLVELKDAGKNIWPPVCQCCGQEECYEQELKAEKRAAMQALLEDEPE